MDKDLLQFLKYVFGSIFTLTGGFFFAKFIVAEWWKKKSELEATKEANVDKAITNFTAFMEEARGDLRKFTARVADVESDLRKAIGDLGEKSIDLERIVNAFRGFVEQTHKRLSDLEIKSGKTPEEAMKSEVTQIGPDVWKVGSKKKPDNKG